ncbi:hypothetical protein niasHS_004059 [Heterodera schachtii]|uniref:N-terminal methionine N(alpha)-acetyltransferase NatE n=1 Tax=Heterodera schachtii TaxID=97005 RepID=A0ABD2JUQ8_HETSC
MLVLRPPDGEQSVRQLMLLNISCLPINYGTNPRSTHYKRVTRNRLAEKGPDNGDECDTSFWTMMAYRHHFNDQNGTDCEEDAPMLVGAITVSNRNSNCSCCTSNKTDGVVQPQKQMFSVQIQTLAVLPTFRRHGVATCLLNSLINQCEKWANIEKIFLHCQTTNEAALCLYRAHRFEVVQQIHGHYQCRAIDGEAADAFLLERRFTNKNDEERKVRQNATFH